MSDIKVKVNPQNLTSIRVGQQNTTKVLSSTTGLQGIVGLQGTQGTKGTQGLQGLQGLQGSTGAVGGNGGRVFYFSKQASNINGYYKALESPSTLGLSSTTSQLTPNVPVLIDQFITELSSPGVLSIPVGENVITIHTGLSQSYSSVEYNLIISKCNYDGTGITTITSSTSETFSSTEIIEFSWNITSPFAEAVTITDRLIFELYATNLSNSSVDAQVYYEDQKQSYIRTSIGAGAIGPQGVQGLQGLQGVQGVQGSLSNFQGTQGPLSNFQGTQGIQGIQGLQGSQGRQGIQATQGLQGRQGVQGRQGIQGVQGLCGAIAGFNRQVIFNNNNVSAGATNFVYNPDNQNVGIGTEDPQTRLEIDGVLGFGNYNNTYGYNNYSNVRIGDVSTGSSITTGSQNNFIGPGAGEFTTDGADNNFFGADAGHSNISGGYNNFIGVAAGMNNVSGDSNTFLGTYAGYANTTGDSNIFIGDGSGWNNNANYNLSLGSYSSYNNAIGSTNIFIGNNSGISTSASGKIILGSGDGSTGSYFDSPNTDNDYQFAVGIRTDSNPSKYWLVGNENFNIGIGTTNPTSKLIVVGTTLITGITTVGLGSTSTPPNNSQMSFELTSDTNLRIKVRGSDGVLRSGNITLS